MAREKVPDQAEKDPGTFCFKNAMVGLHPRERGKGVRNLFSNEAVKGLRNHSWRLNELAAQARQVAGPELTPEERRQYHLQPTNAEQ